MKKFVYNLLLYVAIVGIIVLFINSFFVKIDKRDADKTMKYKSIPDGIEICNVGSSHGVYGYNYADLEQKYNCFNFGLVSQTLSYDYRILDYYKDSISQDAVVFVNVSYFSFLGIDEVADEKEFAKKNKRYYKILDAKHIKQYDLKTAIWVKYLPVLNVYSDLNRDGISRILRGETQDEWLKSADDIELAEYSEAAYKRHFITNKTDEEGNLIINEAEKDALYSIIDLCKRNGWTPVLVTTPLLAEYSDLVLNNSQECLETFYSILSDVVKETGVEYYDYSLDERFKNDHRLFKDGDHMNKEGARVFVDLLYEEVIKNYK